MNGKGLKIFKKTWTFWKTDHNLHPYLLSHQPYPGGNCECRVHYRKYSVCWSREINVQKL